MASIFAQIEKKLVALDKKTLYHWLRHDRFGSGTIRSIGGFFFWLFYAGRPYVGTRVVEIPWVMRTLKKITAGKEKILIVGEVISQKLVEKGYDVDLVDMDAESAAGPRLRVQKMDIREAKLPANEFEVTLAISTLEHIGVQGKEFADGDRLATGIIHRAMKKEGYLLLTVPFGKPYTVKGFIRIYDRKGLMKVLDGKFKILEEKYYIWNSFRWKEVPLNKAESAGFLRNDPVKYSGQNLGLVNILARKI